MSQISALDSASLLNTDLADLVDLPDFKVPNNGYYKLSLECEVKEVNGADAVTVYYTVLETLELADPAAEPAKVGDQFSDLFSLGNEFGVGKLKKFLQPFSVAFGTSNIGALIEQLQGVQVFATVRQRKDKKDETKVYAIVEGITVA